MRLPILLSFLPAVMRHSGSMPCLLSRDMKDPSVSRPKYSANHVDKSSALSAVLSFARHFPCASCVQRIGLVFERRVLPDHASHVLPVREYLYKRRGRSTRPFGFPRAHCGWTVAVGWVVSVVLSSKLRDVRRAARFRLRLPLVPSPETRRPANATPSKRKTAALRRFGIIGLLVLRYSRAALSPSLALGRLHFGASFISSCRSISSIIFYSSIIKFYIFSTPTKDLCEKVFCVKISIELKIG